MLKAIMRPQLLTRDLPTQARLNQIATPWRHLALAGFPFVGRRRLNTSNFSKAAQTASQLNSANNGVIYLHARIIRHYLQFWQGIAENIFKLPNYLCKKHPTLAID